MYKMKGRGRHRPSSQTTPTFWEEVDPIGPAGRAALRCVACPILGCPREALCPTGQPNWPPYTVGSFLRTLIRTHIQAHHLTGASRDN